MVLVWINVKEYVSEFSPQNESFLKVRDVLFEDANILFRFISILFE